MFFVIGTLICLTFRNVMLELVLSVLLTLRYVNVHQQDRDLGDEYGWKQVHGDVFRPSSHPLIFSSLIGSGCQIFSVSLIVIIVAMVEDLYTE